MRVGLSTSYLAVQMRAPFLAPSWVKIKILKNRKMQLFNADKWCT
jgi:hypothetical protein